MTPAVGTLVFEDMEVCKHLYGTSVEADNLRASMHSDEAIRTVSEIPGYEVDMIRGNLRGHRRHTCFWIR